VKESDVSLLAGERGPRISVLMSVYNGEAYIGESVNSVLQQTFRDYELLIVDDGSTDRTATIISAFEDPRITAIRNHTNEGLTCSLQTGLALCRGDLIARLDADDISMPRRLELQAAFLEKHPGVALVGSAVEIIDAVGKALGSRLPPCSAFAMSWSMCFGNPLVHSSVTFRKAAALAVGGYLEAPYAEDYFLWTRLSAAGYKLGALPAVLVQLRQHEGQVSRAKREVQAATATCLAQENIERSIGFQISAATAQAYTSSDLLPRPSPLASQGTRRETFLILGSALGSGEASDSDKMELLHANLPLMLSLSQGRLDVRVGWFFSALMLVARHMRRDLFTRSLFLRCFELLLSQRARRVLRRFG
jgi:glycosyltransferase involved in cell wall biosynthesis